MKRSKEEEKEKQGNKKKQLRAPSSYSLELLALHKKEEEANVVCGAALQRCVSCAAQLHKQTNKINTKKKCLAGSCVGPAPAAPSSKLAPAPSRLQAPSSLPLNISGALAME